jgi:hypothetical protein
MRNVVNFKLNEWKLKLSSIKKLSYENLPAPKKSPSSDTQILFRQKRKLKIEGALIALSLKSYLSEKISKCLISLKEQRWVNPYSPRLRRAPTPSGHFS